MRLLKLLPRMEEVNKDNLPLFYISMLELVEAWVRIEIKE